MQKTQINFRIDLDLLEAIKTKAEEEGIPYTNWIVETCKEKLGYSNSNSNLYSEAENKLLELQKAFNELAKIVSDHEKILNSAPKGTKEEAEELTNAELARVLGIDPATCSRWATGKRKIPEDLEWMYDNQLKKWKKQ